MRLLNNLHLISMIETIIVKNFSEWRNRARQLLLTDCDPSLVLWEDSISSQSSLFKECDALPQAPSQTAPILISQRFLSLAHTISYHRNVSKWDKLYQLLWRMTHGEPHLLKVSSDKLVHDVYLMQKAISRDAHKMKAFVRFCKFNEADGSDYYLAWYKPDHLIVRLVAPFFQRRFEVMHWTIVTPDETVNWNGQRLEFSAGKNLVANPYDELEHLWQTYYKAIFNPARIKINAMKKEMPVRYWHNLPETQMIPGLLAEAPQRVEQMMRHQEGLKTSAKNYLPTVYNSIAELKAQASHCKGCPLYQEATQTVFGHGNSQAKLLLVGEQPGDQEDLNGMPFVGPAGQVLRDALSHLQIDLDAIYMTNAVKHFKFTLKNRYRLHASPGIREINACKPWLLAEIEIIKPKVILCLGLSAAKSLINPAFRIKQERGVFKQIDNCLVGATYHPSAILRAVTPELRDSMYKDLIADIKKAFELSHSI